MGPPKCQQVAAEVRIPRPRPQGLVVRISRNKKRPRTEGRRRRLGSSIRKEFCFKKRVFLGAPQGRRGCSRRFLVQKMPNHKAQGPTPFCDDGRKRGGQACNFAPEKYLQLHHRVFKFSGGFAAQLCHRHIQPYQKGRNPLRPQISLQREKAPLTLRPILEARCAFFIIFNLTGNLTGRKHTFGFFVTTNPYD